MDIWQKYGYNWVFGDRWFYIVLDNFFFFFSSIDAYNRMKNEIVGYISNQLAIGKQFWLIFSSLVVLS